MPLYILNVLDATGSVVGTFVGTEPVYKPDPNLPWWMRGGSSVPTTAQGLNTFTWDSRYPGATTFDGMIIWSARPSSGPKAPPGKYQVRLTAGEYSKTYDFELQMDPNLKGITREDMQEQFEMAMKIRDKTSETNEAVMKIREMRTQLNERMEKAKDPALDAAAKIFLDKTSAIEQQLYQVKNRSNQDPLNFPIQLNNRFAYLRRSLENGDARPTAGVHKVFGELSKELEGHMANLKLAVDQDLMKINQILLGKKMEKIDY